MTDDPVPRPGGRVERDGERVACGEASKVCLIWTIFLPNSQTSTLHTSTAIYPRGPELFDSGGALTTFMHSSCSRALSPHSSLPHYTMPATPRPVLIAHAKVASSEVQMCMPQPPLAL